MWSRRVRWTLIRSESSSLDSQTEEPACVSEVKVQHPADPCCSAVATEEGITSVVAARLCIRLFLELETCSDTPVWASRRSW